jgi:hypothetical protein
MDTKRTRDLPAQLERLRRRFEGWRRTHKARSRISESLWEAAVKLAVRYGLHRTAKALRVDYYSLKKRVDGDAVAAGTQRRTAVAAGNASAGGNGPAFLEWPLSSRTGSCECTLELEDAGGAKMRVHLKGIESLDLAALSRSFWQSES